MSVLLLKVSACKTQEPYYIVISVLSGFTEFFHIISYMDKFSGKKLNDNSSRPLKICLKHSHYENKSASYFNKCTLFFKNSIFYFLGFLLNFNFPERFSTNSLISDKINVLPVGADLFLEERRMDRWTER